MIHIGDCLEILPTLPAESVQCCVTSPPYYGLRDYGVDGQFGLEKTPEEYVEKLVAVFREVRRVLRDDGTVWLNLGDSYASGKGTCYNPGGGFSSLGKERKEAGAHPLDRGNKSTLKASGLKPKDLIGIPWRVAFALQADGWWLRSEIIWAKANPMPESVIDRPTKSHEQIFLLSKSTRYFYDSWAVKEPCLSGPSDIKKMTESLARIGGKHKELIDPLSKASSTTNIGHKRAVGNPSGRNRRSVWDINTVPFPGSHFAVFPPVIPEICIKAGTSEKGCCPECGSPWERVTTKGEPIQQHWAPGTQEKIDKAQGKHGVSSVMNTGFTTPQITTGWRPTCMCGEYGPCATDDPTHLPPIPCTVLDPFSGAGTTGMVAERLDRKYIGIELNPDYVAIGEARIESAALPLFTAC
jgi:DNA modification methylase